MLEYEKYMDQSYIIERLRNAIEKDNLGSFVNENPQLVTHVFGLGASKGCGPQKYFEKFGIMSDGSDLAVKVRSLLEEIFSIGYDVGDALYQCILNEKITVDEANTIFSKIGIYFIEYVAGPISPELLEIVEETERRMSKARLK